MAQITFSTCRRKKDHGRAEALLLLAWALGVRAPSARPGKCIDESIEEIVLPAGSADVMLQSDTQKLGSKLTAKQKLSLCTA